MFGKVLKFVRDHTEIFKIWTLVVQRVFDIVNHDSKVRVLKFYTETLLPA